MKPVIFGLSGQELTAGEAAMLRCAQPAGYILFAHNIATPDQVRALTDALRDLHGRADLPILIDQEGGRVARLKPPHWPEFPAAARFGACYDAAPITALAAAHHNGAALGQTLSALGITVNCAPVLDLYHPHTHAAIGDRSFGSVPLAVAALGRAMAEAMREAGVAPVIKHVPGQGRASLDSHHALPFVDATLAELEADFAPFRAVAEAVPFAMTGHVVFTALDAGAPATLSSIVIDRAIRGMIGFEGLLLSDDLHMDALTGSLPERASAAIAAGCDLALACWARGDAVQAVAQALPDMDDATVARLASAMMPRAAASPAIARGAADDAMAHIVARDQLMAAT